jgi:hypothetical protein
MMSFDICHAAFRSRASDARSEARNALIDLGASCSRLKTLRDEEFTGAQLDAVLDSIVSSTERLEQVI